MTLSLYSLFVDYFNAEASSSDYTVHSHVTVQDGKWIMLRRSDTDLTEVVYHFNCLLSECAGGKQRRNSVTLSTSRPRFEQGSSRILVNQLALFLFSLIKYSTTGHFIHLHSNHYYYYYYYYYYL